MLLGEARRGLRSLYFVNKHRSIDAVQGLAEVRQSKGVPMSAQKPRPLSDSPCLIPLVAEIVL